MTYAKADTPADNGIVINQANTIDRAVLQLTAFTRIAVPTPIMEPLTTCVVDTGKCNKVAVKIVRAEFKSAAKPLILSSLKILLPTVAMIFQPPAAVPNAIAVAQASFTHNGTSRVGK